MLRTGAQKIKQRTIKYNILPAGQKTGNLIAI
jgi:hypothetical protein